MNWKLIQSFKFTTWYISKWNLSKESCQFGKTEKLPFTSGPGASPAQHVELEKSGAKSACPTQFRASNTSDEIYRSESSTGIQVKFSRSLDILSERFLPLGTPKPYTEHGTAVDHLPSRR